MTVRHPEAWARALTGALLFCVVACDGGGASGGDGTRSRTLRAVSGSGVAECDAYLTAYESCINSVITNSATRATALEGLEQTKASWADLADEGTEREMLARMCVQAQRVLAENSCSWSGVGTGSGGAGSGGSGAGGSSSGGAPGSGGSGGGGCTVQSAQQISVAHSIEFTVQANACFKVSQAPTWTANKIKLQARSGGTATFPISFTWFQATGVSCTNAGTPASSSFTQLWNEPIVPPSTNLAASCPVVFSLSGNGAQTLKLMYFYQ